MPRQTRRTGRAASRRGFSKAAAICYVMQVRVAQSANFCVINGTVSLLKTGNRGNRAVHCTPKTLELARQVVCAFSDNLRDYQLYAVSSAVISAKCCRSPRNGQYEISRGFCRREGVCIGTVDLHTKRLSLRSTDGSAGA